MHLIFEPSNGHLKSNCNILALAWMPYYAETKFRQALLDYHQKQLINLTQQNSRRHRLVNAHDPNRPSDLNQNAQANHSLGVVNNNNNNNNSHDNMEQFERQLSTRGLNNNHGGTGQLNAIAQPIDEEQFINSRLAELYRRYTYTKFNGSSIGCAEEKLKFSSPERTVSGEEVARELDAKYGRMAEFGWLVVGNVGKIVGVTLTSIVPSPIEIDGRQESHSSIDSNETQQDQLGEQEGDLIVFKDDNQQSPEKLRSSIKAPPGDGPTSSNDSKLEQQNGDDFDVLRPDRKSRRTNYNLRGHLDEIILVRWNELYQKLATVDSKGNVLIWCKINEKFTIQTPFYNRTKSVADFKWSNDGKTALICYTDSFILVGSSSGQRHWHSMLNLDEYHITCASWTPNDEQLLLGVSNGNVVIIDLPNSELTELVVSQQVNIRTICWSTYEMNLSHLNKLPIVSTKSTSNQHQRRRKRSSTASSTFSNLSSSSSATIVQRQQFQSAIVNQRRLSRDCSIFSRNRFCSPSSRAAAPSALADANGSPTGAIKSEICHSEQQRNILAIEFANSTIKLYDGGLEDPNPTLIRINLESFILAWSLSGKILAVAGFNIHTSAPSIGCLKCRYANSIKFFNQQGRLIYEYKLRYSRYPITAFTWAHDDQRILLATGPRLHCARVFSEIPALSLLVSSSLHSKIRLSTKFDVLELLASGRYSNNLLNWQSFNCPVDIKKQSMSLLNSNNNNNDSRSSSLTDNSSGLGDLNEINVKQLNNVNVLKLSLPTNLKLKIDELFGSTIRQPFDEQLTLSDIVWHVPKNQQRYYCTLICYTSDLDHKDIGSISHQYRSDLNDSLSNMHGTTDQYKVFVLYIEFEGSLVPILRARRIGQLKPEFVIYDPGDQAGNRSAQSRQLNHKVSDVTQDGYTPNKQARRQVSSGGKSLLTPTHDLMDNCSELHQSPKLSASYDQQTNQRARMTTKLDANNLIANFSPAHGKPNSVLSDPYLRYISNLRQQQQQQSRSGEIQSKVPSKNNQLQSNMSAILQRYNSNLVVTKAIPTTIQRKSIQSNELVRIRSNVWGTKFKIVNVSNRMIKQRVVLGSVAYKASILHLQPRQIYLTMRDMSNYCVLCSSHHHVISQLTKTRRRSNNDKSFGATGSRASHQEANAGAINLIDLPRIPDGRSANCSPSIRHSSLNKEKVFLSVGDNLRVAPKLEPNQKYSLAPSSVSPSKTKRLYAIDDPRPSTSKASVGYDRDDNRHPRSLIRRQNHDRALSQDVHLRRPMSKTKDRAGSERVGNKLVHAKSTTMSNFVDDDILTLSLDQGDQVRVQMSTLNSGEKCGPNETPGECVAEPKKLDEFLESNKTLKSIQTITKMIIDLSSKVDVDDTGKQANDSIDDLLSPPPSPEKIIRLSNARQESSSSNNVSSRYIPPETPVHRPRRRVASRASAVERSQSANTTPLTMIPRRRRQHDRDNSEMAAGNYRLGGNSVVDYPLPEPPPSVPIGRRLASSAKRFFDGSLRSLYGSTGGGASGYSSACGDLEPEECEPLVSGRTNRQRLMLANGLDQSHHQYAQSQPCTPIKHRPKASASATTPVANWLEQVGNNFNQLNRQTLDLVSLKGQLLERVRRSTTENWRKLSANNLDNEPRCRPPPAGFTRAKSSLTKESTSRERRPKLDCAKRSMSKDRNILVCNDRSRQVEEVSSAASGVTDGSSTDFSSSSGCDSSVGSSDTDDDADDTFGNRKRISAAHSVSAKNLNELDRFNLLNVGDKKRGKSRRGKGNSIFGQQPHREKKRSICHNPDCCCTNEFKLSNRPPVWNEFSQVYQLDFGGRVTQESAKNLQIEHDGNLALQFGRIDRCTYTLDYKYPFNAVQAMAIALASLTQRMK